MLRTQRKLRVKQNSRSSSQAKSFLPESECSFRLLFSLSRHAALHCSQTVVTQAYSLLCIVHEGVIDEHTPFKSQWWICSQIKTGSIAGAVSVTQLSGNGHAACAHLTTGWVSGKKKCKQTFTQHCSQRNQVIYLPFRKTKVCERFTV